MPNFKEGDKVILTDNVPGIEGVVFKKGHEATIHAIREKEGEKRYSLCFEHGWLAHDISASILERT